MAVRFDAPIYTTSEVLNEAGILLELEENPKLEVEETEQTTSDFNDLSGISMEELEQLLNDAVKEEDYDTALRLQEEIKEEIKNRITKT
jgi:bifunctional DNase/RNase